MKAKRSILFSGFMILCMLVYADAGHTENSEIKADKPRHLPQLINIKTNVLPWIIGVPEIGGEITIDDKWSADLGVMYCPWKISNKFALKTISLLPSGRWWLKTNRNGHFFDFHLNVSWFNLRIDKYRYQDAGRPLLGCGLGYGYKLEINSNWSIEFEIGAGYANMRYDRFHNVKEGALIDTRVTDYFGIDKIGISFVYRICEK